MDRFSCLASAGVPTALCELQLLEGRKGAHMSADILPFRRRLKCLRCGAAVHDDGVSLTSACKRCGCIWTHTTRQEDRPTPSPGQMTQEEYRAWERSIDWI
jgi:hypothetical protein